MPIQKLTAVLLFCVAGLAASAAAQSIQIDKNNRTIAITTTDNAKATADVAQVHIGYQAYAPDAATAYARASDLSNTIIAAVKKYGVPDSAIHSNNQSISEQTIDIRNPNREEELKRRFVASQSWTVVVPAANAGGALHAAVTAGADDSGSIDWTMADEEGLQAQASAKALQRARQIAEQMAKGLNARLGALIYASNEAPPPPNFALPRAYGQGAAGGMMSSAASDLKLAPLVIIPQDVTKSATVYAVFALE